MSEANVVPTPSWYESTLQTGWSPTLPRVGGFAGFGGELRVVPEDFCVEEVPAYLPSGEGNHLFLRITKRGLTTRALVDHVARCFQTRGDEIGTAGLKDRHAVTTQWVSVNLETAGRLQREPESLDAVLAEVDADSAITVEEVSRHANKLRTGHLTGNRFEITVRSVDVSRVDDAALDALVARLSSSGCPNYFGEQRFGRLLDNVPRGLALLRGRGGRSGRRGRRFLISAVQSAVFNAVAATRCELGLEGKVLAGDVLMRVESGGCFRVESPQVDQARLDGGELVTTAPMPGTRLMGAGGAAGWLERALTEAVGLEAETVSDRDGVVEPGDRLTTVWPIEAAKERVGLRRAGKLARGLRRAMMVRPHGLSWRRVATADEGETSILVSFELPAGSYATSLLREFTG